MPKYTIEDHWDQNGTIRANANPQREFEIWQSAVKHNPKEWDGTEFTLKDFERYIEKLKEV